VPRSKTTGRACWSPCRLCNSDALPARPSGRSSRRDGEAPTLGSHLRLVSRSTKRGFQSGKLARGAQRDNKLELYVLPATNTARAILVARPRQSRQGVAEERGTLEKSEARRGLSQLYGRNEASWTRRTAIYRSNAQHICGLGEKAPSARHAGFSPCCRPGVRSRTRLRRRQSFRADAGRGFNVRAN